MVQPKEKAKKLVWRYLPTINGWEAPEKTELAVKLALICVDEIIKAFNFPKYDGSPDFEVNGDEMYWIEVKEALTYYS